jgi:hypothetical protein
MLRVYLIPSLNPDHVWCREGIVHNILNNSNIYEILAGGWQLKLFIFKLKIHCGVLKEKGGLGWIKRLWNQTFF